MKHAIIDLNRRIFGRSASLPHRRDRRQRFARPSRSYHHPAAAMRFADICAAVGGVTMLHDLMPDVITVSFGDRTQRICDALHARGWTFVGTGDWDGEQVLGVSFGGDRRARMTADKVADALIQIVGEMEIADTRVW